MDEDLRARAHARGGLLLPAELSVDGDYWFAGRTALWMYGAGAAPPVVEVAVRDTR